MDCAVAVTVARPRLPATTRKATAMRVRRTRRDRVDRFENPAGAFFAAPPGIIAFSTLGWIAWLLATPSRNLTAVRSQQTTECVGHSS